MKKIMIIAGSKTPIPAVLGGATETMMTHLLNINEIEKKRFFYVLSHNNEEALDASKNYLSSFFSYYKRIPLLDFFSSFPYRVLRKITKGKTYLKSRYNRWCVKKIQELNPDIVVIEGNYFQVMEISKSINKPVVLHMHIDGLNSTTDNGFNIYSSVKSVIVISDYCKKSVLTIPNTISEKVFVLKNTVDVTSFVPNVDNEFRETFRDKHNVLKTDKLIVYCGRLSEEKGVKDLLIAFKNINRSDIKLVIIGSSWYKNAKKTRFVKELESIALSIKNNIIFTGYINQKELPKYYNSCDIAVVPSKCQEAAGNVIIEALACGLPVIASKKGGIPEYADENACVLIDVDVNFSKNIQDAICLLVDNKEIFDFKKKNARNVALKYGIENYYKNFLELIDKTVEMEND